MLLELLRSNNIPYEKNVSVGSLTRINQKNILPIVSYPVTIDQLTLIIKYAISNHLSYDVFGNISNTYICNSYSRDIVIIITHICEITMNNDILTVGCGYNLTKLSLYLSNKGIQGYEGFVGIPGTVGGAVYNNAGAFSSEIEKVIVGVNFLTNKGEHVYLKKSQLNYSTRTSVFKEKKYSGVILSIDFNISKKDNPSYLEKKITQHSKYRKKIVDCKRKSLGSVFVSSTMTELFKQHRTFLFMKKIINIPNKILFHSNKINTILDFLFLGIPSMAKHCENINRFCWDNTTSEEDFFNYINTMQKLALNKLRMEIEIKE